MRLLPIWAQAAIGAGLIALIFGAGWTVNGWRLGKANVKLKAEVKAERANSEGWANALTTCQENRIALGTKLDELAVFFADTAAAAGRLDGAARSAHQRAAELAEAREALATLESEHADFIARTADMTVCQTYEAVLVALVGSPHDQ